MLQIADKDRLGAVLAVIEKRKIRFPVAEIHKKLGGSKGTISEYLAGKKPISENFYRSFMSEFEKQTKVEHSTTTHADDLHKLIETNNITVLALKDSTETTKDLAEMLKGVLSSSGLVKDIQPKVPDVTVYLQRIASEGAKAQLWASPEDGLKVLSKFLRGMNTVKTGAST